MNPEQLLNAVEECIKERPDLDTKLWAVCWHEDRLKCLPSRVVKRNGNVFGVFNTMELNKGLSLEQWSYVARRITEFFERKKQ